MTVLTTSAGQLAARSTSRAAGFRVELLRDWKQAVARWHDINPSTPFRRSLLSALRRMPEKADLIRLRKVPVDLDGKTNPLALLGTSGPCALNGNLVTSGEDYDAWRHTLGRDRTQGA
jgi:hypothetical protein